MQTMDCYVFSDTHIHTHTQAQAQSKTVCLMFAIVCAWTRVTKAPANRSITWSAFRAK